MKSPIAGRAGPPRPTHAAGVVISEEPLTNHVPFYKGANDIVTQYSMGDVEKIGLVKFDFLGLKP
jgi:DNA polymerase-3 subunit alpha